MYWLLQWLSSQCTLCIPILGYYEMWNVQMHHNMGNICQLYIHCTLYIDIGSIMAKMWLESKIDGFFGSEHLQRCKFVLNIRCQQFGGYVTVEYVSWYLIYNANIWRMNVSCRVSVWPSGTELGSVHFYEISSCIGYRLQTVWGV